MSDDNFKSSKRDFIKTTGATAGLATLATVFGGGSQVYAQDFSGLNAMGPTPGQVQAFLALPDRPVVMVNLLKFKPNGGREEYQQYASAVEGLVNDLGGEFIFIGDCQGSFIGGAEWDEVILVRYPSARSLMQMARSPAMAEISGFRRAGLEGQMNLTVFERDQESL